MVARLFLSVALALTLTSCASLRKDHVTFLPPSVDCAAFDPPKVAAPTDPALTDKDVAVWQLHAWHWQAVAEHLLGQRVETAKCLARLREVGIIK